MKNYVFIVLALLAIAYFSFSRQGKTVKNIAFSYITKPAHINTAGMTVSERVLVPENFSRKSYPLGSFARYIQTYALKSAEAKVINYDGTPYRYQRGHVGVLEVPVPSNGLQQCADALMRLRAEFLWDRDRQEDIGFNFTSGHYCSWLKYAEGFRPKINGNNVTFHKTALANHTKENFYNYLNLIYTYAGTQSLSDELKRVERVADLEVGDMVVKPGFPGHIVMIADKATNASGEILFILAQGNTPAQSIHLIKNLKDTAISPWYRLEEGASLEIPTYFFDTTKFVRFN